MVIKLEPPVLEPSTKILKLYAPTDSEYKLHKVGIRNDLTTGFKL